MTRSAYDRSCFRLLTCYAAELVLGIASHDFLLSIHLELCLYLYSFQAKIKFCFFKPCGHEDCFESAFESRGVVGGKGPGNEQLEGLKHSCVSDPPGSWSDSEQTTLKSTVSCRISTRALSVASLWSLC